MQGIVGLIVIILIAWLVWGWLKPATYTGYFYYDPSNLEKYSKQGGLESLDACRDWVSSQVARDFDGEYDYECGKNCKLDKAALIDVCETTEE
jgi:hypothetical protein